MTSDRKCIGINESYLELIYQLVNGDYDLALDPIHVDVVETMASVLSEGIWRFLRYVEPGSFFDSWELYYDDKNAFYDDADYWKDYYCPEEVPEYGVECQRLIDNLITQFFGKSESWESICKLIVKTSDLNNPDSPAIQLFHKMLMLRDDIDQPSYMMRYYFKYFVSEYNDLLTESGYYGSNIKRYSDAEIKRLMPKVMPKVI